MAMEEKLNELTAQRPDGKRAINAALVTIDLSSYMSQIKEETSWKDGKRNAITVFKTNGLRMVLIALHEGSEMARHTADGIISIQLPEGKIQFHTDQQSVELDNGRMLALREQIPHCVTTLQETISLLTLTNTLKTKPAHL
jgi:quercetin dioxygenase-like cupin family protein